jgi:hypothetical protein
MQPGRALAPVLATAMALPALGCTGAVAETAAGDAETARTTSAVVIVERTVDATGAPRVETSARFARVPAGTSARDALRTIGAAIELPAAGTCASLAALAGGAAGAGAPPVIELVDVGAVSLETGGRETHLVPRQLPDVTDVVSGVVYARAADPALFPSSARYLLRVSGSPDVEPFEVTATAPADPSDMHVAGEDAAGVSVPAASPIDVAWTPSPADDALYIEVQPAGFRCTFEDAAAQGGMPAAEGSHATVPASLVAESGTLVLHRVHREALSARGLEGGEIRFDFSRAVAYARR